MIKYIFTVLALIVGITISSTAIAQENNEGTTPVPQFNISTMQLPPGLRITIARPMFCSSTQTFVQNIVEKFGEKSVFAGMTEEYTDLVFDLLYNKQTQSFTIAQHFAVGNTCILATGTSIGGEPTDLKQKTGGHLITYSINK